MSFRYDIKDSSSDDNDKDIEIINRGTPAAGRKSKGKGMYLSDTGI